MKLILQVHYLYITFTIDERKVSVILHRHVLLCVSNVFILNKPVTTSLDRPSGYVLGYSELFGFFSIEISSIRPVYCDILDFVPVLAQCFSLSFIDTY